MTLTLQVKLLRVMEKQCFRRVGGLKDISVDVRIISATNRNLDQMVADGLFREDLYYRLKVIPLCIPPLRERPEDVTGLADHFLQLFRRQFNKSFMGFTTDALEAMMVYSWPGNIRELRNVLERAVLLNEGNMLTGEQLNLPGTGTTRAEQSWPELAAIMGGEIPADGLPLEAILAKVEEECVRKAMETAQGNKTRAAELLGLSRDKLRYRLDQYGIKGDLET